MVRLTGWVLGGSGGSVKGAGWVIDVSVGVIIFQKIFRLYGLKGHIVGEG